ncbi:MAG: MBL fold metallo-hydrolase, partial [Bdellovibrionaceae bacterium]|nr:MBL fold metallo-hydrolase [Bdellovibrio sp.]
MYKRIYRMSLTISRILHAGYLFSFGDTKIVFDPIFENPFSTNCYAFPPVEFHETKIRELQLAAVFISHYHDDHCSLKSLNLLNRATPIYIFCQHAEMLEMVEQLGFNKVESIELNQPIQINEFEIIARRALDAEVDSIFHIRVDGMNILNVVDSWIDEETLLTLEETTIWDLILWPFQTMREIEVLAPSRMNRGDPSVQELPPEWIRQIERLKPKIIVPSSCQFKLESWSWYNQVFFPITYKKFEEEINRLVQNVKVLRLDPSQSVELSLDEIRKAPAVPWVRLLTTAIVDYDFDATVEVPKTSEIA